MKLKVQSSKLKKSSNSQAPSDMTVHGLGIWTLGFILSFELCFLSFRET
jgi:hypothetical protein